MFSYVNVATAGHQNQQQQRHQSASSVSQVCFIGVCICCSYYIAKSLRLNMSILRMCFRTFVQEFQIVKLKLQFYFKVIWKIQALSNQGPPTAACIYNIHYDDPPHSAPVLNKMPFRLAKVEYYKQTSAKTLKPDLSVGPPLSQNNIFIPPIA